MERRLRPRTPPSPERGRAVDPDHVGAHVGQHHGAEGSGAESGDLDDADAGERSTARAAIARAMLMWSLPWSVDRVPTVATPRPTESGPRPRQQKGEAMGSRDPVIVGIGWSDYPVVPELDAMEHHALALRRALADSGLQKSDIDGYMCAGTGFANNVDDAPNMAEYLRINHRWIDGTSVGGSTFEFYVQHAAAAIETGMCDVVLVTYGSDMLSRMGRTARHQHIRGRLRPGAGPSQFECSWGNVLAGGYAMAARRHMHEYGTTPEQLAEIAVGVREYAGLNPRPSTGTRSPSTTCSRRG